MSRLKKIALNLEYAKNMVVPAVLDDSSISLETGADGKNARFDLSFIVTKNDFSESYRNEFTNDSEVKEKLKPNLKDKAKKLFSDESSAYISQLWEAFTTYITENINDDIAAKNLQIVSNTQVWTTITDLLAGQGIHLDNDVSPANLVFEYKDITASDEAIKFTIETWIDNIVPDENDVNLFHTK